MSERKYVASLPNEGVEDGRKYEKKPKAYTKPSVIALAVVILLACLALIIGLSVYFSVHKDKPEITVTEYKVEVLIQNATSGIGEGPHWDSKTQSLLYVDIYNYDVHRWDALTGQNTKHHFNEPVTLVIPNKNGGYIVSVGKKIVLLNWETGNYTVLAEVEKNIDGNRFNDGKCDPEGRLWAGTMSYPDWYKGSLYRMDLDGSIHKLLTNISISNGLAWTKDGKTMYYIDSKPKKIYAFDYDNKKGIITNQKELVDINSINITDPNKQPDGMTIDTEDKIWVAIHGDGKVIRFDPKTGAPITTVHFPTRKTTSCTFGGKNLDELYVTSAGKASLSDPYAGAVFKVTGLGVRGNQAFVYHGKLNI